MNYRDKNKNNQYNNNKNNKIVYEEEKEGSEEDENEREENNEKWEWKRKEEKEIIQNPQRSRINILASLDKNKLRKIVKECPKRNSVSLNKFNLNKIIFSF